MCVSALVNAEWVFNLTTPQNEFALYCTKLKVDESVTLLCLKVPVHVTINCANSHQFLVAMVISSWPINCYVYEMHSNLLGLAIYSESDGLTFLPRGKINWCSGLKSEHQFLGCLGRNANPSDFIVLHRFVLTYSDLYRVGNTWAGFRHVIRNTLTISRKKLRSVQIDFWVCWGTALHVTTNCSNWLKWRFVIIHQLIDSCSRTKPINWPRNW